MGASNKVKLILAFRSGGLCALCNCRLTEDGSVGPSNIGEAAHIAGENPGKGSKRASARYDPGMTPEQRNHYDNLIYLCSNCHTKIDKIPEGETDYPTSLLLKLKAEHESKVISSLIGGFSQVGFPELEEATAWVSKLDPTAGPSGFDLLAIKDKIAKNGLSHGSQAVIAGALGVTREVGQYVRDVSKLDPDFPERLKAGFLAEYWRLRGTGLVGDELFDMMCRFAQRGFESTTKQSAGLAVMVYLFETCEIFEK